ncbi:hypothetical protein EV210_101148 [Anaerospora hongkongensis]|uniref:Uncharacterized protein n=1 Tax=Anaerospora hongkongensis TaxID=244830 RepID=A0A4R1Q1Y3_9FIRM|nr:hypothetical protein [Anaerospora hongkongensis]TCL39950.1 hypothetical protein EV210_101148 [Anaerospora hongkongensis]
MAQRLDTRVTPESLERNFEQLNRILDANAKTLTQFENVLSDEQKKRIAAMNEAIRKVNEFIEQRIKALNDYITELLISQQELAVNIDTEIRETIAAVEASINSTIDEVKNVDIPSIRNAIAEAEDILRGEIDEVKNVDLPNMQEGVNQAIAALDQAKVSHATFNDKVNELAQADGENRSLITQTANNISSVVGKLNQAPGAEDQYIAISSLKQTADSISTIVSANKSDADGKITNLTSQLTQTAGEISSVVAELDKDQPGYVSFTKIKQTTDGIASIVSANKSDADNKFQQQSSSITQNADSITAVVGKLNQAPGAASQYTAISSLKQQADSIASTVSANKTDTDGKLSQQASQITQTAGQISSVVTNLNTDPFTNVTQPYISFTKIKQTTDAIQATVSANKTDADGKVSTLNSQINAVPGQITAAVTSAKNDIATTQINPLTTRLAAVEIDVNGIHQTVVANKADADGKVSQQATRIDQLPDQINLAVTQSPTAPSNKMPNLANLRVSIEGLTSTVSNQAGQISAVNQKADSIQTTVASKASTADLQITNNSISAIVTELEKSPENCAYSAITALKDQIDLVSQGNDDLTGEIIVSRINLSPAGVKLKGRMIEIDGNTVISGNLDITGKLTASNLGALSGGVIGTLRTATTGARIEIKDNLIIVYDENNVIRVRMGVW